jgi:hypothetical protein
MSKPRTWSNRSSVALDEETYAISRRVGNFSEFVRECLRRWNAYETQTHVHPTETNKCYPRSKKGCCILCWPDGMPAQEDWLYFRNQFKTFPESATQYIEEKARELNETPHFPIPQEPIFKKTRTLPKTLGMKGYLSRLFKRK